METVLAHVRAHPYIYGAALVLLIAIIVLMNIKTYEAHVLRTLLKNIIFPRQEGFQDQQVVASGVKIADTVTQDHCQKLKDQINVYENLKITHKDVRIENLDETIKVMKEYFVSYNCE